MALYRQNSTGFLCEFASNPGAGYNAVSAMPVDTITNKVNWYRTLDTYGQTSSWHPSLQSTESYPDTPLPPGLSGSGVNIAASRYQTFEESGLPPLSLASASVLQTTGGYHGSKCIKITSTSANGVVWCSTAYNTYNIKLTPNKRWIISLYCTTPTAVQRSFSILLQTASALYTVACTTSGTANTWQRVSGTLDLRGDATTGGTIGIRVVPTNADLLIDAIMLEERVGDGTEPSAYSGESGAVDGDQVLDATLSADKIAAGTIGAQTIIMDGSSSILKSSNFAAGSSGWQIKGDGSAEFANVTVRGTLNASDLTSGYINGLRFGSDSIGSGPVVSGALHAALGGNYEYSIAYNTGAFPVAGSTWIGPLTLPANTDRTKIMIVVSIMPMNSAAVSGRLVACIQRGSPNGAYLPYSNFNMAMPATMIHTLSFTYFDSTPGTGSLNYYTGIHQNITSGTAQNCRLNWMLLEISK